MERPLHIECDKNIQPTYEFL